MLCFSDTDVPVITSPPQNQEVSLSSPVDLTCTVSAFPLPMLTWLFVDAESGVMELTADNVTLFINTTMTGPATVTSTLTLPAVQLSHDGLYICSATNSLGNATAQADITVFGETFQLAVQQV